MTPSALALVLLAAVLHAAWNRLLHLDADRAATMVVANAVGAALLAVMLVRDPPVEVLGWLVASVLAQTGYVLALTASYERGSLEVAYPIARGSAPLLVTLGGWAVLAQRPSPAALAGAVALLAGLTVVGLTGRRIDGRSAIAWAALTGVCIAGYSTLDARGVRDTDPSGYLAAVLAGTATLLAAASRPSVARLRASLRPGLLVGVGSTAAYLLVLFAFQRATAGRVSTVRETSVLLAVLLGGRRPSGRLVAGAVLIASGAVLAAL